MFLRNNRVGILDLATGESAEEELPGGDESKARSSVELADALAAAHGADSLVLGTGVLTGSFAPASCCGIVRAPSSSGVSARVAPVMGFAGVELKLTGFDFIVIKGESPEPAYVWARDGMIEIVSSPSLKDSDSWARTDCIRSDQGDAKIQVLSAGPWGNARSPGSQFVVNYWGGEDKLGLGSELGRRNLLAIAFRGMGELEVAEPEVHFEESVLLMREQIERLGENEGLASYTEAARRPDFKTLVHRVSGCYGCPFPCRSFLKTSEDPREMRMVSRDPGYLHYDVPSLEMAFDMGMDARGATELMIRCAKAGAEPGAVLAAAAKTGYKVSTEGIVSLLAAPTESSPSSAGGNFERSFSSKEAYLKCLGLGLCPRYWSRAGFEDTAIAELLGPAIGD
jgi:aldehyde:ferredoxin oxidoreductase